MPLYSNFTVPVGTGPLQPASTLKVTLPPAGTVIGVANMVTAAFGITMSGNVALDASLLPSPLYDPITVYWPAGAPVVVRLKLGMLDTVGLLMVSVPCPMVYPAALNTTVPVESLPCTCAFSVALAPIFTHTLLVVTVTVVAVLPALSTTFTADDADPELLVSPL